MWKEGRLKVRDNDDRMVKVMMKKYWVWYER